MSATLIMICGLPGAGKTGLAKLLEQSRGAFRLCPDEWIKAVIEDETNKAELDRLRDPVEVLQWQMARRLLSMGLSVILENGFWSRQERERFRLEAKRLGARVELHYLEVSQEELWRRIERRNLGPVEGSFQITREELDQWWDSFTPPDAEELAAYDEHAELCLS